MIRPSFLAIPKIDHTSPSLPHFLHKSSRLCSELALFANVGSEFVEQELHSLEVSRAPHICNAFPQGVGEKGIAHRHRQTHECKKSRYTTRPVYTKVCIHITRKQRKRHSEQTSQDRVGSESGGSIDGIGIDEIIHDSKKDEDHTESKRGSRSN